MRGSGLADCTTPLVRDWVPRPVRRSQGRAHRNQKRHTEEGIYSPITELRAADSARYPRRQLPDLGVAYAAVLQRLIELDARATGAHQAEARPRRKVAPSAAEAARYSS